MASVTPIAQIRAEANRKAARQEVNSRNATVLLVVVGILTIIGLGATLSASSVVGLERSGDGLQFFRRQILWVGLGVIVLVLAMRVPYQWLRRAAFPLLAVSLVGLLAVLVIGEATAGARRWITIGPLTLQPSEFAKFAVVTYLAAIMTRKEGRLRSFGHFAVPVFASLGLASVLIMLQPDLGTTLIIAAAALAVLVISAAPLRYVLLTGLIGFGAAFGLAYSSPYRWERITSFLDPWADQLGSGFQVIQSYLALGTGGAFGVGLGASRARWSFLPNAHTDFIFSIIGEETGFAGGLTIFVLFAVFAIVGLAIVMRAPDRFGQLLGAGLVVWISAQAVVNIGGVIGVLPVTGITLPFVSVGGSAMLMTMGAAGVLVNIARVGQPPPR
ncbi:MAG: putative lipid II flippase FtsW [Acidimicrobiia bacterium]